MSPAEIKEQLLKLHRIITKENLTCSEIIDRRTLSPNISLLHYSELSGKVPSGSKVPLSKYHTIGDRVVSGTEKCP